MADLELRQRNSKYDEKNATDSVEKASLDSTTKPISDDDAEMVKEVEALEERIQHDEAVEEEYRVAEAYEVAIKVRTTDSGLSAASHPACNRCCPPGMTQSCLRSLFARSSSA